MNVIVPSWASSTRRLLHPFSFVPSVGSVKIAGVSPGDAEVLIGSALQISVRISNPGRRPCPARATLFVRQADKPEAAHVMLPGENNQTYVAALSQVLAPLEYRLQVGDSQTRLYRGVCL